MSKILQIDALLNRCVRRVRREFAKEKAWRRSLPEPWLEGYATAMRDLVWDLYSLDNVLKEKDWLETAVKLRTEDLRTVGPDDYFNYFKGGSESGFKAISPGQIDDLERPIRDLTNLLDAHQANESKYQELIARYPWILGAQYSSVEDHRKFDDENIPDFTGVRARDNYRDILEIKSPFMPILRRDSELTSEINEAWNQVERYLKFARDNRTYLLREKGLIFENPRCFLLAGYQLTSEARKKLGIKQTMNPAIEILTYDDLKALAVETVDWIRNLKNKQRPP